MSNHASELDHLNDTSYVSDGIFNACLASLGINFSTHTDIAVAVSGGPDSMGLSYLLSRWAQDKNINLHAIIVDHNLRPESAEEAQNVAHRLSNFPHTQAVILKWENDNPESRLMEAAREARYGLIKEYCNKNGISVCFIGHHLNDQAETLLFRLAKGSGLDGLGAMRKVSHYGDMTLCRPLLNVSKTALIATCEHYEIPYVNDPSNEKQTFARPRLREGWHILEREGMDATRLGRTAERLARASDALAFYAEKASTELLEYSGEGISLNLRAAKDIPKDICIRVLHDAILKLNPEASPLRLHKVEKLWEETVSEDRFRKQTLADIIFSVKGHTLIMERENRAQS